MATGFGQYPFGHVPFGHPFGVSEIIDLAYNPLDTPSTGQMIGYLEADEEDETLGLEIYRFVLESIRLEDRKADLFLRRFLQGPQQVWETTQLKILDLRTLWDVTTIDERWLKYLKSIVGWTPAYDYITDELTSDQLRYLISSSIALWKSRGSEDSMIDLLTLVTDSRMRIWNWFDYRWILDETVIGEEHDGFDAWMISIPASSGKGEYWSNLRIVDNGDLNKKLVRDIVGMMRAVNERFEIIYLSFLDTFEVDDDSTQWYDTYEDAATGSPMSVANGEATLGNNAAVEKAIVDDTNAQGWDNYVCYWRAKISQIGGSAGTGTLLFYVTDLANSFSILIDVPNNRFGLGHIISGTPTYSWYATLPGGFVADIYYGFRIVIAPIVSTGQLNVTLYVDNVEMISETITATYVAGSVGFGHSVSQTITVSEIEVARLPIDSDLIVINTE